MRTTGKIAIVTSVLAGAAVPLATPAGAQAAQAWVAYHDLSASQSVARVTRLKDQGYRPITVNVSDGERYAAVWVKGGSAHEWGIWQGMSASGFQKRFDAGVKEGAQPTSVSATGPADSPVFTAVFEKKKGAFVARAGLTPAGFAAANKEATAKGLALTSVDAYGTADDVRYVGVWSANGGGAWYYTYGKSLKQHEAEFYAKKEKGFRPVRIAVAPDGTYAAVWRKDGDKSWAHYVDMSASGYQKRFDDLKAKGLAPVQVNAENGKYAAIWQ
ncbi:hypothetical protein [Nonomuraea gerenzanensis]|uniref:Beta-lactamase n=1 Tax=Nonomuraea gerenzanensis TaxID=93944 RepID=A0A1M4E0Q3_9ACTN|nr:hypothetical protein [Nonomuraea gerenzanensis]UBU14668.1 hypothetical protein LCN96_06470 [Nonomuraea gerenzanensis]SBO92387.1 Beta-lactamase [Nonomuraea gerenzanensis]